MIRLGKFLRTKDKLTTGRNKVPGLSVSKVIT